jgi:hypothetical protein
MLDDLRQQADAAPFEEEEEPRRRPRRNRKQFLGMSAFQRFIISLLLLLITCLLGVFTLLVTERIVLPFL